MDKIYRGTNCIKHDSISFHDKSYLSESANDIINTSLNDVIVCMNKKEK